MVCPSRAGSRPSSLRLQRDACLRQALGLQHDRRTGLAQRVSVLPRSGVRHGQDQPPADRIVQCGSKKRLDRRGIGSGRTQHREVVGHGRAHLLEPALVFPVQKRIDQFAASAERGVEHRLADPCGVGHRLHVQLVQSTVGQHRHRRIEQLLAPLPAGESGRVLAPLAFGHPGNATPPLYSCRAIATVALY